MDKIGFWCKLISSFSVISALFLLMIPEGTMKKAFNTLMTVILTFVLIFPFDGRKDELLSFAESISSANIVEKSEKIQENESAVLISVTESEIENYLNNTLDSRGIDCVCEAVCSFDNSEIHIIEVIVSGAAGQKDEILIREIIEEISEGEAKVRFNGEEYD